MLFSGAAFAGVALGAVPGVEAGGFEKEVEGAADAAKDGDEDGEAGAFADFADGSHEGGWEAEREAHDSDFGPQR